MEKGCAALAQSKKDKNVMSAKKGSTRKLAEAAAKASCLSAEAGPCKVRRVVLQRQVGQDADRAERRHRRGLIRLSPSSREPVPA